MKITLFFCASLLAIAIHAADSPRLIPFQGRITDSAGQAIADGARSMQFQIYGEPSGGAVFWAGEVHRATVNGGLVNVMLGSKNSLPVNRMDDPNRSFFDAVLYLQITVDANNDGKIDVTDPPLLPRQSILPVVFADDAANSRKLVGYDWSSLLVGASRNPETGKIRGDKIQEGGITALQLAPGAVTTEQLANGAVTSNQLAAGAVAGLAIAAGSVGASQIGNGAVTQPKLAPRQIGANVPAGGVAISQSSSNFVYGTFTYVDVPNLSITITTTGRPVFLGLIPDGYTSDTDSGSAGFLQHLNGSADLMFYRNDTALGKTSFGISSSSVIHIPCGSIYMIDAAPAGTYTYKLQARASGAGPLHIVKVKLIAYEL